MMGLCLYSTSIAVDLAFRENILQFLRSNAKLLISKFPGTQIDNEKDYLWGYEQTERASYCWNGSIAIVSDWCSDIFVILHYALVLKRCRYFNIIEREWINGKTLTERSVTFALLFWHILFE